MVRRNLVYMSHYRHTLIAHLFPGFSRSYDTIFISQITK